MEIQSKYARVTIQLTTKCRRIKGLVESDFFAISKLMHRLGLEKSQEEEKIQQQPGASRYIGVSLNKKDAKQNSNFGKLGNWVNVWYVIFVFLDVISLPLMLTTLSANMMFLLDRLILVRYSIEAMNAVAVAAMSCAIFQFGGVAIASIAEVFVGQYNGAGQHEKTSQP
eukprot:gene15386-15527_t